MRSLNVFGLIVVLGLALAQTNDPDTTKSPTRGHMVDPTAGTPTFYTESAYNYSETWTTYPDGDNTTELSGLALMEHLFEIRFHADVFRSECEDKLIAHGYRDRLPLLSVYCLCLYTFCEILGYELGDEDLLRIEELKKITQEENKEIIFNDNLPMTAGVTGSYAFIALVGLFGNLLVLITVSKFMHKPSVTYIFICSIACSDLLVCGFCAPMKMYKRLNWGDSNLEICRAMNFLYYMSLGCSVFSLVAMSMERYIVICHPMKAQSMSTASRAKKIVLMAWFAGAVVAIPWTYYTRSASSCIIVFSAAGIIGKRALMYTLAAVYYIIPVILMTFAYTSVCVALWRSIKTSKSLQNKGSNANGAEKKDSEKQNSEASGRIAVIKMLILVLVVFVACWSPYWLFSVLRMADAVPLTLFHMFTTIEAINTILAYLNSAVNPLLYAFSSKPMRDGFIDCFLVCCGKPPRSKLRETTTRSVTGSTAVSASVSNASVTA